MEVEVPWTREQGQWTRDQAIDRFGRAAKCAGRFVQRQLNNHTTMPALVHRNNGDDDAKQIPILEFMTRA
jgi:hypothetical protein